MGNSKVNLHTLKKESENILAEAFTSSFWIVAAICSIIGLFPAIKTVLHEAFDVNNAWIWTIPLWISMILVFAGVICIYAYIKLSGRKK